MKVTKISFNTLKKLNKNGETTKFQPLSKLTTFKTGGVAKYFVKISTIESFIKVMWYLKEKNYPFFILGNGSNVLASSKDYNAVIIKLDGDFNRILVKDDEMECGAAVLLPKAFVYARDAGLSGFECGAGIPATIGGATYMNASSYGFEMAKIVDYVVAFNGEKIVYLTNADCKFGYRKSVFQENKFIILRVGFKLKKSTTEEIVKIYQETLQKKRSSQPYEYPSAGCVFKRQEGITVSKMLDDMGAKGLNVGGAKVSEKHANFIINFNNATSEDIFELIKLIKKKFFETYNIKLNTELEFLGDFDETNR